MLKNLEIQEGLQRILERLGKMEVEEVETGEAAGRVLAKTLISPENIPPFRRSPLDGYAFRAEDTRGADEQHPVVLDIIEEIPAGKAPEHTLGKGQAVKILTGAPLPEGADAIEKFEVVQADEKTLTLIKSYQSNQNVVPVGEDIAQGDLVLAEGTVISPAYQGILAGLGFVHIPVYKKPRVCLISTGSELVPIDAPIPLGKIRNSSIYTLKAFLEENGASVRLFPLVPDDLEQIAATIRMACEEGDLVFTTGGVSVGDYDMLLRSIEYLGGDILFWKLKMKPGSAFLASYYKETPVISLSGSPAAAAMALFLIGIPVLRKLGGRTVYQLPTCKVRLAEGFQKKSPVVCRFLPGRLEIQEGQALIHITPSQGNGILHPLHGCNVLAEIPAGSGPQEAGTLVKGYLL